MKILIVNAMIPHVWSESDELAAHLEKNLNIVGHEAEILRIPFSSNPIDKVVPQMLMCENFKLFNVDKVIALKFPAYMVPHSDKILWLLHQFRQSYDLKELKSIVTKADTLTFKTAKKIFTNSKAAQHKLKRYNNAASEILNPPLNTPELFTGGTSEGYIFAGGRISSDNRQHMLIEALAKTSSKVRLLIAGSPDSQEEGEKLFKFAEKFEVANRVKIDFPEGCWRQAWFGVLRVNE